VPYKIIPKDSTDQFPYRSINKLSEFKGKYRNATKSGELDLRFSSQIETFDINVTSHFLWFNSS